MGSAAWPAAYAAASAEPRSDALTGSARLNPRSSRAVNKHDNSYMII